MRHFGITHVGTSNKYNHIYRWYLSRFTSTVDRLLPISWKVESECISTCNLNMTHSHTQQKIRCVGNGIWESHVFIIATHSSRVCTYVFIGLPSSNFEPIHLHTIKMNNTLRQGIRGFVNILVLGYNYYQTHAWEFHSCLCSNRIGSFVTLMLTTQYTHRASERAIAVRIHENISKIVCSSAPFHKYDVRGSCRARERKK